ncbi:hypothetical protein M413DRAFT_71255 [Hebeloma cylindrosporum]|uniref:Protein YAE1 n=1 Tax=Hebeloma cylindrosporum TaxID=76867 RepID=A0A0C2YLE0_HEBCY|nr:hypothetical protein M413DRAFT_71255 [Hebeloma cylindrosporum h7]
MDSPWDENPENSTHNDIEWSRISSEFTNVGYREGITAGKEAASQEGFDAGFANVGVPIGRELGLLRGTSSVVLAFLKSSADIDEKAQMLTEAQEISSQLSRVRFSDIMPRDIEAEEHAREHLEAEGIELDMNEVIADKREVEGLEDMLANLSAYNGKSKEKHARPTIDDVQCLKDRLRLLTNRLDLGIAWS